MKGNVGHSTPFEWVLSGYTADSPITFMHAFTSQMMWMSRVSDYELNKFWDLESCILECFWGLWKGYHRSSCRWDRW